MRWCHGAFVDERVGREGGPRSFRIVQAERPQGRPRPAAQVHSSGKIALEIGQGFTWQAPATSPNETEHRNCAVDLVACGAEFQQPMDGLAQVRQYVQGFHTVSP